MNNQTTFVCIGCPIGCPLQLEHVGNTIEEIAGHQCNRGAKYARQEFTDPRRSLSTSVAIDGGLWERLPVKTSSPIPKNKALEIARLIHKTRVKAPVSLGQVILEAKLGEEKIEVVATRSMSLKASPR